MARNVSANNAATNRRPGRTLRCERGEIPIAFVAVLVIVLLMIEAIVVGARVTGANAVVANAAREAARQGSLTQTNFAAGAAVDLVGEQNLDRNGQECVSVSVIDTSYIDTPDADGNRSVTAIISCTVDLDSLSLFGLPLPNTTMTHSHTEPIEKYRAIGEAP